MRVEAGESSGPRRVTVRLPVREINGKRQVRASLRGGSDDGPCAANAAAADDKDKLLYVKSGHAVTRDQIDRDRVKPTIYDLLRHAQRRSGRRPMELAREYARLHFGRGKLTLQEYVQYGVYDWSAA